MITQDQITQLARKNNINKVVILREYLQLLFLSILYSSAFGNKIYFKGGTAIHLLLGAARYSEDLDFTVHLDEKPFLTLIESVFKQITDQTRALIKPKKTIIGKKFLITLPKGLIKSEIYVSLDFSFREEILDPQISVMPETEYPILFSSHIHHLSPNELLAEKIRACLTRVKGRDIYDLWYLLASNAKFDEKMILTKLSYYQAESNWKENLQKKIQKFNLTDFIYDIRPFIKEKEREQLPQFFKYIQDFLAQKIV